MTTTTMMYDIHLTFSVLRRTRGARMRTRRETGSLRMLVASSSEQDARGRATGWFARQCAEPGATSAAFAAGDRAAVPGYVELIEVRASPCGDLVVIDRG